MLLRELCSGPVVGLSSNLRLFNACVQTQFDLNSKFKRTATLRALAIVPSRSLIATKSCLLGDGGVHARAQ